MYKKRICNNVQQNAEKSSKDGQIFAAFINIGKQIRTLLDNKK